MNLFFVYGSGRQARIMTPALTGTLLPGITRDALLTLAPELGIPAEEGKISVAAMARRLRVWRDHRGVRVRHRGRYHPGRHDQGRTACWTVGGASPGPVTMRLREQLLGIQFGQRGRSARLDPQDHLA